MKDKSPEQRVLAAEAELSKFIKQLKTEQKQISIVARLTADFNAATSVHEVIKALSSALTDLGYQYLSTWIRRCDHLEWDQSANVLPGWLTEDIQKAIHKYKPGMAIQIWVPLYEDNLYARCYHSRMLQSTKDDNEVLNSLVIGETSFTQLPKWLQNNALKLMKQLDIEQHNALSLGNYGIIFLSSPATSKRVEPDKWLQIIFQQAQVAIARVRGIEEIRIREEQYRALFERTNDAVFILSLDLVNLAVNQQAANLLGYKVDELVGMHASQIVAPEEWQNAESRVVTLKRGEIPPIYNRTFVRKDGSRVLTEVSIALVHDQQGNPSHIQSIVRDITERVATLEQLRLKTTALEAAANGIMITDNHGTILWANTAIAEITGYTLEEIMGNNPRLFGSDLQPRTIHANLWNTILSGNAWRGELVNEHKDGNSYTIDMTITPVRDNHGEIAWFVAIAQDVSEQAAAKQMLEHLATYDSLTNLPNRNLFFDRLSQALALARREEHLAAILFVDVDDFKLVNDHFGHKAGDLLLQSIARKLQQYVRESDTVSRMGGDEFTILLSKLKDRRGAARVADKIIQAFKKSIPLEDTQVACTLSIGIAIYPLDSLDAEELLKYADQAMYAVKQGGKNGYRFHSKQTPQEDG